MIYFADARIQGLTEPDPRDDLNGMDVARKALILAREIGCKVNMADVYVESMISESLEKAESVEVFMDRLDREDETYRKRAEKGSEKGEVLRYMAVIKDGHCDVRIAQPEVCRDRKTWWSTEPAGIPKTRL